MQFASRGQEPAGFGLAPLLDVVLLLLIFFVVSTSFTEPRLAIALPDAETAAPSASDLLVVSIARDGEIAIAGEPASEARLDALLSEAGRSDRELELRADERTPHGAVVALLDRARKAGVASVGFAVAAGRAR